jgi:sucrose-6-phosphate hydrolase SacC (GH32 family)
MEPAKEIEGLRISKPTSFTSRLQGMDNPIKVPDLEGEMLDIEILIDLKSNESTDTSNVLNTEIFGNKISYNLSKKIIDLSGIKAPLAPVKNKIKLRLIIDRTSIELFANDGVIEISKCFVNADKAPADMSISGIKDLADVTVKTYQLKSVWNR